MKLRIECSKVLRKYPVTLRASCTEGRRCGERVATPSHSWHESGARSEEAAKVCRRASLRRYKCCKPHPCAPATPVCHFGRRHCHVLVAPTPLPLPRTRYQQGQHNHNPALCPRTLSHSHSIAHSHRSSSPRHWRLLRHTPSEAASAPPHAALAGDAPRRCRPRAVGAARSPRA